MLSINDLGYALTTKRLVVLKTVNDQPVDRFNCNINKDSLAKELYNQLFNWIVKRLNQSISNEPDLDVDRILTDKKRYSIGLLDIFGFEFFNINGIEQFFINFANEKL